MPSLALLQRQWWISSRKLAEKHLGHARQLLSSQEPADIYSALGLLDTALKLCPQWEKALELKARALLCLRRFKDVANLLHDFIPSLKNETFVPESPTSKEKMKLLSGNSAEDKCRKRSFLKFFSVSKLKKKLAAGLSRRCEREQWRYLVLGQACCHLGMMEDAMILLSSGKRAASAAFRKQSNCMREDSFCSDIVIGADSDLVSHLLGNIKFLLRRRTAALAALEAGLYTESARHFSKIVDGRRGTPQGFIAECYMHRATAYQAAGRVADAIADCNRTLALNPMCAEALSTRASLYEMIRCFSESVQDLEQLKVLYETVHRHQTLPEPNWMRQQNTQDTDFQGCLDYITSKIAATRERRNSECTVDYHSVLGLSRGCSRAEVERAYLLISLKHRPDKAAHFVDRCEFVDDRDIEAVKDEARSSALRLFRLIQRAYAGVMSMIMDEELQRDRKMRLADLKREDSKRSLLCNYRNLAQEGPMQATSLEQEPYSPVVEDNIGFAVDDCWLDYALQREGGKEFKQEQVSQIDCSATTTATHTLTAGSSSSRITLNVDEEKSREPVGLEAFPGFNSFGSVQEDAGLADASLFPQVVTCREVANVGSIISQGLSSADPWMSSSTGEWNHQTHTCHPLSVT